MRTLSAMLIVVGVLLDPLPAAGQGPAIFIDPPGDASARPADPGATLPFPGQPERLPDLLRIALSTWTPDQPHQDVFAGVEDPSGPFLRLELTFRGLVNPPGNADPFDFQPFRYGPQPLYGFVEIDIDGDADTGGELDAPQYRYLGNAARFGGHPRRPEFAGRVAVDGSAFDADFTTPPFVERHGEEFHLALLGTEFVAGDIRVIEGDADLLFEPGEIWDIRGAFFHRAHGFEPFSFVEGGRFPGEYAPPSDLRFQHDVAVGKTRVTLVFPLTQEGAALLRNEATEPANQDPTDQASVFEALADLQLSAFFLPIFPTGLPEEAIIAGWADLDPNDHLDPGRWTLTALVGTSHTEPSPDGVYFVWTDIFPDVVLGDVNGSGTFDGRDRQLIAQHVARQDAIDGILDGVVIIRDFAEDFSLFDVNYDGVVDAFDLTPHDTPGDMDGDGDVDLWDYAALQRCFHAEAVATGVCASLDLDRDANVDLTDMAAFRDRLTGPGPG